MNGLRWGEAIRESRYPDGLRKTAALIVFPSFR